MSQLTIDSIAKVFTGKPELLKDLDVATVLALHPLLDAQSLDYVDVKKTVPIKARPINTILDKGEGELSIFEKMLLGTLEGSQTLKRDAFICWGVDNDVWQQAKKKIDDQYTLTDVDCDGWLTFTPKPEAERNGSQIVQGDFGPAGGWACINNTWGDRRVVSADVLAEAGIDPVAAGYKSQGGQYIVNLHYGVQNDWVIQRKEDQFDTYRIAETFFRNTHSVVS